MANIKSRLTAVRSLKAICYNRVWFLSDNPEDMDGSNKLSNVKITDSVCHRLPSYHPSRTGR